MNDKEFFDATGQYPVQDDLERANCTIAGTPGHDGCGVCEHGKPVFLCKICFAKPYREVRRQEPPQAKEMKE